MRIKHAIPIAAAAAITFGLASVSSAEAAATPIGQFDLIAGQNVDVGDVIVSIEDDNLTVEYQLADGWLMTASHLAVGDELSDLPVNSKGNPVPGSYPYSESYDPAVSGYVFAIPLDDINLTLGEQLYIAAHAVVWEQVASTMTVISDTATLANGASAVKSTEPGVGVTYPDCPAGDDDAIESLWDSNAKLKGGASPVWGDADWIWSTSYPANPMTGEVVNFSKSFTVPGLPIGGSLTITADNAYSATLNSAGVGTSISAGPAFGTTVLKENVGSGNQQGDWGVASQGWQLVNQWPLTGLTPGANQLMVTAANEYLNPDDSYLSWDAAAQAYVAGSNNIDPGVERCINPAGLIFKADVSYYSHTETAWGGGTRFVEQGNWAMYHVFPT
jgi:hypothetical protein